MSAVTVARLTVAANVLAARPIAAARVVSSFFIVCYLSFVVGKMAEAGTS